jgi:hypothetical protein
VSGIHGGRHDRLGVMIQSKLARAQLLFEQTYVRRRVDLVSWQLVRPETRTPIDSFGGEGVVIRGLIRIEASEFRFKREDALRKWIVQGECQPVFTTCRPTTQYGKGVSTLL